MLQFLHVEAVGIEPVRLDLGEPRPELLLAALGIVVEAALVLAPEAAVGLDHRDEELLLVGIDGALAELRLGRPHDLEAEIERHLVVEGERPDRHAGHPGDVLDHRRGHTLGEHLVALADVGEHAAVGEEAAGIVDDDAGLLDRPHVVEGGGDGAVAGLVAADDLHEQHLLHRREEVDADELLGPLRSLGEARDRQGRGVGGEDRVLRQRRLDLCDHLGLHLRVLEHRLDDEVAVRERGIVRRRGDAGEQGVAVGGLGLAAVDLARDELVAMRLAGVGRLLVAVDQDDRHPGLRCDVGDARAHEAGADHADLGHLRRLHVLGPAGALVDLAHGDEERADHRLRFPRAQDVGEVAALDLEAEIHRKLQALIDRGQDGLGGRIVVVGLAAVDRVGGRPDHHAGGRVDFP